ncbi:hypothetical protein llap_3511 [Limosa lapponica baueri]|uniref:Uncharacterized protein n=1 Tax=Limosa lapponica baueri TaxID=1758121 RepID=A0A2I0UJI6_LIMLA|nr:hypothetical protein llap_3511 [Limosa lapponica baueri]
MPLGGGCHQGTEVRSGLAGPFQSHQMPPPLHTCPWDHAQAMAPSPWLGYPQLLPSPIALQLCQPMDFTDPDPELWADSPSITGSDFITMDRLAATGLGLTLVPVTGPDPGLRAVFSP